jgi:hypothetical protein
MGSRICILALLLVPFSVCQALSPSEWRWYSPILKTQTRTLTQQQAGPLLARFCQTPVRTDEFIGKTCTTRRLGRAFSTIVDRSFQPKGVIYGHFLAPESNDAAVSGWSAECHPGRWGGTLLLTNRGGVWIPVWYRSRMIIDVCEKIALPDRREILLCEDEDGGMGHAFHDLYSVDFAHPTDLEHSLLAEADSFDDGYLRQAQVLRRFHWRPDKQGFSVELDTTEWQRLWTGPLPGYPKRRPASLRLTFAATNGGVRKVATGRVHGTS